MCRLRAQAGSTRAPSGSTVGKKKKRELRASKSSTKLHTCCTLLYFSFSRRLREQLTSFGQRGERFCFPTTAITKQPKQHSRGVVVVRQEQTAGRQQRQHRQQRHQPLSKYQAEITRARRHKDRRLQHNDTESHNTTCPASTTNTRQTSKGQHTIPLARTNHYTCTHTCTRGR